MRDLGSECAQSRPTLWDHMDYNPPGSFLSMGFPRQEYWSGLHFLLQRIFPTQGSNLHPLPWQADSLTLSHLGKVSLQISKF